jgi:hypothetical protein
MPSKKTLLADYFLGFATREISGGARPWRLYYDSASELRNKKPACTAAFSGDLYITDSIKDVATSSYPAIGPYDLTDSTVAEFHVLLAKAAGIDGFMAEYTMGQEKQLLTLVRAAHKYNFQIGVNWISQSHLGENPWRDRAEAMEKAHEIVRWLAREVYLPCGVEVDGKFLVLIFLAHPREPAKALDPFFSPSEVNELKRVALDAGMDANFLVLPWENLPALPEGKAAAPRVWDGYFPWVWTSSGAPPAAEMCWTHYTSREQYLERLRSYYAMAKRVQAEGRINIHIGAVCPGFDDHKGQAWGEGFKRCLARDGGATLRDTWRELKQSDVAAALIITWNDWVENSQVEPSLELGDADLRECAKQAAEWKQTRNDESLLGLPLRLFRARRAAELCARAGVNVLAHERILDRAAEAIAALDSAEAAQQVALGEAAVARMSEQLTTMPFHILWEYGFDSVNLAQVEPTEVHRASVADFVGVAIDEATRAVGFAVADTLRPMLHDGHFVGRLCIEYLDVGDDFLEVRVDATDEAHQIIASFKKTNTGRWLKASMDLVNASFKSGLGNGSDIRFEQRQGGGAVRMVRIDGHIYRG